MAVPWKVMNRMRSKIRQVTKIGKTGKPENNEERRIWGDKIRIDDQLVDERFYTYDRDSGQIVTNFKTCGWHFIFDLNGNLIKQHQD